MNGIIVVNKPVGLTSHQVINKIKRILKVKKIGHAGTLDPLASGVLIVLVNDATRLSDYLMADNKEYLATIAIGCSTTTEDCDGEVLEQVVVESLDEVLVDDVLSSMIGQNIQTPPMFSAIKQDGKKLYELAREGKTVERKSRQVYLYDLKRTSDISFNNHHAYFTYQALVSKGTYIRTLCVDIGKKLGFPAHMKELVRTKSGIFSLDDSYTIKDIENGNFKIIPMIEAMKSYKQINIDSKMYFKVKNGQKLLKDELNCNHDLVCLIYENNLMAIYRKQNNYYKAERVWK